MKVTNTLTIYEYDGEKFKSIGDSKKLIVRSIWNDRDYVVLETPDGHKMKVLEKELRAAIANTTNT